MIEVNRKGKNNTTTAQEGDVGSTWGIGSKHGGHKDIHPELGSIKDFKLLIADAKSQGIEIAMDYALQAASDHPWVKNHPDWFKWRPDGTVQYAENPPKKYQDILPIYWESKDYKELWKECLDTLLYWVDCGIEVFRVDNPHTKPYYFWHWVIEEVKKKEGYIIVTLGWIVMSASGVMPYIFSGAIPSITNAFFETISGYTTTGASILDDIESIPKGILFWRSLTHWIGGMGIIVLAIAILPLLGIGGMQLFSAEAPGPSADKLHPRITDTAKRLWLIYVGLTITCAIAYWIAGMNLFDAIGHSFSTVAIGGFSTHDASLGYFHSTTIEMVASFFMLISGINFALHFSALRQMNFEIFPDLLVQQRIDDWFARCTQYFVLSLDGILNQIRFTDFSPFFW